MKYLPAFLLAGLILIGINTLVQRREHTYEWAVYLHGDRFVYDSNLTYDDCQRLLPALDKSACEIQR